MTHAEAIKQYLEPVFPEAHELGQRIFWDGREGQYYDAATDLYLWDYDPTMASTQNGVCGCASEITHYEGGCQ